MPHSQRDGSYWEPDWQLLRELPGGEALEGWFGFLPSFHDAGLDAIESAGSAAKLVLSAFRMTTKTDDQGYFVLDKHATVTIDLDCVTVTHIQSEIPTTLLELRLRPTDDEKIELAFDDVCGGSGTIIAEKVEISFQPTGGPE